MSYDRTYRKTTTTARNNNRGPRFYAPPPAPPGGHNRQHSVLGYWVPLVTIGTIAVGGLAAWIWSERSENDDDGYPQEKPPRPPTGMGGAYPTQGSQPYPGPSSGQQSQGVMPGQDPSASGMPPPVGADGQTSTYQGESSSYYQQTSSSSQARSVQRDDQTFLERMSGAMRRTPSPQQFFDSASKQVSAGFAAAGSALGSIMEVDSNADQYSERQDRSRSRHSEREGFSDHERWSEEAEEKQRISTIDAESAKHELSKGSRDDKGKGKTKRAVAVVLSSDVDAHTEEEGVFHTEHAVSKTIYCSSSELTDSLPVNPFAPANAARSRTHRSICFGLCPRFEESTISQLYTRTRTLDSRILLLRNQHSCSHTWLRAPIYLASN